MPMCKKVPLEQRNPSCLSQQKSEENSRRQKANWPFHSAKRGAVLSHLLSIHSNKKYLLCRMCSHFKSDIVAILGKIKSEKDTLSRT